MPDAVPSTYERWTPPEPFPARVGPAHHSELLAVVAAVAALVLFVGAFAAIATTNDGNGSTVSASAPDDDDGDGNGNARNAAAGSGVIVDDAHSDDHAHPEGDDHAHDETGTHDDGHAHDAPSPPKSPSAQPASAPAPAAPQCDGATATTTTSTTTTTTTTPHNDGHHHLTAAPTSLRLTAPTCDETTSTTTTTTGPAAAAQATTTTLPGSSTPPTTVHDDSHHHPPIIIVGPPPPPGATTTTTTHGHHGHWPGYGKQLADLAVTQPEAAYQIVLVTHRAMQEYPTARQASAGGFPKLTKYFPGIAAHYVNVGRLYDNAPFDASKPEVLLYDGDGPNANLVGINYIVRSGDEPPEGFPGDWDEWHEHKSLCLKGGIVVAEAPSPVCSEPGVTVLDFSGFWLLHVWSIPDWVAPEGLFSHENSLLK